MKRENDLGTIVVDCAVRLHTELGPGLLETVYEVLLAHMLQEAGLKVEQQVPIPIEFHGIRFEEGFRADIVIENAVILELKSVETVSNAHKKQVLTYLRLTGKKLGYLLNFGEATMKDGITRVINGEINSPLCPCVSVRGTLSTTEMVTVTRHEPVPGMEQ